MDDEDIIRTLWWRLLIEAEWDHYDGLGVIDAYLTPEQFARLRALTEDAPEASG